MGSVGCLTTAPKIKWKNILNIKLKIVPVFKIYFYYKSLVYSHKSISHTGIALQNIKKSIMKDLDFNVFF